MSEGILCCRGDYTLPQKFMTFTTAMSWKIRILATHATTSSRHCTSRLSTIQCVARQTSNRSQHLRTQICLQAAQRQYFPVVASLSSNHNG